MDTKLVIGCYWKLVGRKKFVKIVLITVVSTSHSFLSAGVWLRSSKVWLGRGKILCMWCEWLEFREKFIQVSILCHDKYCDFLHWVRALTITYLEGERFLNPGTMMMLHAFWGKCFSMRKLHIFHQPFLLGFLGKSVSQPNNLRLWGFMKGELLGYLGHQKSYAVS